MGGFEGDYGLGGRTGVCGLGSGGGGVGFGRAFFWWARGFGLGHFFSLGKWGEGGNGVVNWSLWWDCRRGGLG